MRPIVWMSIMLVGGTFTLYWPATGFDFVDFDDDLYVFENGPVMRGLTPGGLHWAMTANVNGEWHPLTMVSHMIDVELFGRSPRGHHLVNVALHAANAVLLLIVLTRLTGCPWRSGVVAAVFALHPLNMESVAWVSQRKSVLSTLFWLAAMWAYAAYVDRRTISRYLWICVLVVLGLICKPMLVTLPCALLLLDVWPLRRIEREPWRRLVLEKLPLFAVVMVVSVITLMMQSRAEGIMSTAKFPLLLRCQNALVAYLRYLEKLIWPVDLAVPYPFPTPIEMSMWGASLVLTAVLVIVALTAIAAAAAKSPQRRYLIVGWLWFLGVMVPVSGLIVQQGGQAMADRFMYIPMIGLLVAIVWVAPELIQRRAPLAGGVIMVLIALAVMSHRHLPVWRNTQTLFENAIAVTDDNALAYLNLGHVYFKQGDHPRAVRRFSDCLRISPLDDNAAMMRGVALLRLDRHADAIRQLADAAELAPEDLKIRYHLAIALMEAGRPAQAVPLFESIVRAMPQRGDARALLDEAKRLVDESKP